MERLTDKRMKGEGFIPVDHKEYKAILREEKPTAKQIYRRLLEIEDILGDDYDLERLAVMMNQCMSMRDEVQARFRLTAKIPLDQLKELVELVKNIPHVCKFCVGCEMEPKDGHGCDEYDSFVFSTRRLQELADADLDGRCVVMPCGVGDSVFHITTCKCFSKVLDGTMYGANGEHGTATGYYCPCELAENCPFLLEEDGSFDCEKHKNTAAIYEDVATEIVVNDMESFVRLDYSGCVDFDDFGKTVFLTREAAEAALKGERDGKHL